MPHCAWAASNATAKSRNTRVGAPRGLWIEAALRPARTQIRRHRQGPQPGFRRFTRGAGQLLGSKRSLPRQMPMQA